MLFSSMTFIFVFLPIVLFLYFIVKKELRNTLLLLASLVFYAFGATKHVFLMLAIVMLNYVGALLIDRFQNKKKFLLVATIFCNLTILIFFKYFNFIYDNVSALFNLNISVFNVFLPLGISFYIFQALSYVIDVYRGEVKVQKNLINMALYICLFPQLVAGPIIKYHDIEGQIVEREVNLSDIAIGSKRFIIGLSKKVLLANALGEIADKIFLLDPSTMSHSVAWLGSIAYSLQLFFDFSGYSDMAIGLGLIFGFKFMENFNYPYISKSITEFWHRWHMSLSSWFKQYVYIPLGGNKNGIIKTVRNLGIVFLLTGIWHGAAWNFVVWGIWHGFFIILEKVLNLKEFEQKHNILPVKILMHIYCILVFVSGWVIFRAGSVAYAFTYLKNMFFIGNSVPSHISDNISYYINSNDMFIIPVAILCCFPVFKNFIHIKHPVFKTCMNIVLILLLIISTASIAADTYNPFIYFRF